MSDLLRCTAIDRDGTGLGRVHDVRLCQDGPLQGTSAALRLDSLVVGGAGLAVRIGATRSGGRGPWPLVAPLRWLERRAVEIPWSDVTEIDLEHRTVRLGVAQAELDDRDAGSS